MTRPILALAPERLDEVVGVLAAAFADYPVMRHVLGDDGDYDARLPRLIRLFAGGRALRREPMLGACASDGALLGVATMTPPDSPDAPEALVALRRETWRALGGPAQARYDALVEVWTQGMPPGRRHHLNMIGVPPAHRGLGIARDLLEAAIGIAQTDATSTGLDLSTEHPANLPLYRHFGFEVVSHARVSPELETWTLVRGH